MDSQANSQPVICEVCGTYFETRRGLSSHARLHLRQLGVTLSESSGAPIDLLYQLVRERDGSLPNLKADASTPGSAPLKKTPEQEPRTPSVPEDGGAIDKTGGRITTLQKLTQQGSLPRPKESSTSLFPSSPLGPGLVESKAGVKSSSLSSPEHKTPTKPLWAPLETDAPITLDTNNDIYMCQLCGMWYETYSGMSGHARAHLRHLGIPDSKVKGDPVDFLYQIMEDEDLKPTDDPRQKNPQRPSIKRPSNLFAIAMTPAAKKPRVPEECTCILCGEEFENRTGLACHARFHLKQAGVVDLMGKSSAIDTLRELVVSGMLYIVKTSKKAKLSKSFVYPAPALSPAPSGSRASAPSPSPSLSPAKSPSESPANKAPKAKKGFRLAVDPLHRKPKPQPQPVEGEASVQPQGSSTSPDSPVQKSLTAVETSEPFDAAAASSDAQSPPTVLCDYCGQLFETRKALSCHARAHLRQLGLSWSIKSSPIDLLKDIMVQGEGGKKKSSLGGSQGKATLTPQGSKKSPGSPHIGEAAAKTSMSPLDFSMKDKSPSEKPGSSHMDTSCELCGFDFENRKALASHARAHLRQLGIIEWKADGASSPIELLYELIRKDPAKVSAITRRYRTGDLYIKKSGKTSASPSPSTEPDSAAQHHHRKGRDDASSSRHSQDHTETFGAHSDSRGGLHPPNHEKQEENQDTNSQQPPRTGSIPAMLPKPPLTPLVKLVGKMYSLKCRFCEKVFHGPLSVQEQWIAHLQEHILSLGYKGKASPPAAPVAAPALVHPVAV